MFSDPEEGEIDTRRNGENAASALEEVKFCFFWHSTKDTRLHRDLALTPRSGPACGCEEPSRVKGNLLDY